MKRRLKVLGGLVLVVMIFVSGTVFAAQSAQAVATKDWDKTKEYTAQIDKEGLLFWCGNKEVAVLKHKSRDVSTIIFYKSDLTDTREETVNFATYISRQPICSDDGRYVFFAKQIRQDDPKDLVYYDRKSKKLDKIFSYKKTLGIINESRLISPKRKYFVTPSSFTQITLPGIGSLKGISLDAILDKGNGSHFVPAWELSDNKLYLLNIGSQTLSIIDPNTLQKENISVEIENYSVLGIEATSDPNKLFLVATHELDQSESIYLLDLKNEKKPITLFVKNIESLDVSSTGIGVYAKINVIQHSVDEKIHPYNNTKKYVSVDIINSSHTKKIIKKINSGKENSRSVVIDALKISPNGNSVAFISRYDSGENMKIHVIQKIK